MQDFLLPASSKSAAPIQLCRQYADAILHNARSIGLQVTYDKATPTDGNCFYHAVVESLSYYGINFQGTHLSLRKEVANYVRQNENLAFVQTNILTLPEKESFSHATELFVFATAMYLSIFILVTMEISNGENPYVIHYPNEQASHLHNVDCPGTFIILIGHSNTFKHFQSLKFIDNLPSQNNDYIDFHVIPNDNYNYEAKRKCKVEETVSKPKRSFIAYHRNHNDIKCVALDAITPSNMSKTSFIHPLFLRRHLKCMVPVHHL